MNQIENKIKEVIKEAIKTSFDYEIDLKEILIELPKDKNHGDYASNIALQLSRKLKDNPRNIAQTIIANLDNDKAGVTKAEIAGPGFINFTLEKESLGIVVEKVLELKDNYGRSDFGQKEKYNLEFVSANPTGDLHPGHARGAAMGDSTARIMEFAGYDVTKEYYINDGGNQVTLMGLSLQARYFQHFNQDKELPLDGYQGNDLIEIAVKMAKESGDKYLKMPMEESLEDFITYGLKEELTKIKETLKTFGVIFDVWTSEKSLYKRQMVEEAIRRLKELNVTYEKDGALWLKTTDYKDDKDRVLIKSDGSYTYLTPDVAYHLDKFDRGYDKLVDFLGADHHGYISRLKAAICALGRNEDDLSVDIIQMARMIKDGQEYKISKRTGRAISLADLLEEAGVDAIRYLFVCKAADTHMDLDLDLAIKQSNDNPVYYAQYAHARMCSILRNVDDFSLPKEYNLLTHEKEMSLLKQINVFTQVVNDAAKTRQPHRLCNYIQKLASVFHSFYSECRVITDDFNLQNQRLALVKATQITLKNALTLIGVTAVERM